MPKEDYLLKYLEKLSRVISAMLGLREKGFAEDALKMADETFVELLNQDLDSLLNMPNEQFIELIKKEAYSKNHLDALAEISYETVLCFDSTLENQKMRIFSEKALLLYKLLNEKDKTFSFERESRITDLKQIIATDV